MVLLASTLGACDAQQQDPQCVVARAVSDGSTGSFATSFTLVPGEDPAASCARLKPEVVGLQKYFSQNPAATDRDPNVKDRVGIRSQPWWVVSKKYTVDPDAAVLRYAVGDLTTDAPGPDNYCEVPSFDGPTRVELRSAVVGEPGLSLTYAWSNVRIYNTPDIPGTLFVADLTYAENTCLTKYKVKGIWPVVTCSKTIKVDGKDQVVPDETKCDPKADPSVGRLRGSGINPSFDVKCDPDALICVLKDPSAAFP
ncbi:Putative lipoprotein mlpA precursor [Archangium gephyra]|uniref:Lipoprotein mlpA n=1 Tax=Archangium gephyra TaxID=48 RepID=A0AAC8Q4V9_9BACT|nr:Putative lipoprotein mlpA precursor [Archangium gephyra]